VDDAGFAIDGVRFLWPTSETESPWSPDTYAEWRRPTVSVGDFVHVFGALRADGVVVVASVDQESGGDARRIRFEAGVVEAIGADSITVAGALHHVAIADTPSWRGAWIFTGQLNTAFSFAGGAGSFADLRVGDAVLLSEFPSPDAGGEDVLGGVQVLSNGDGDPVSITGPVTRDYATYQANEPSDGFLGVAGALIDVDETMCFVAADRTNVLEVATGLLAEGDTVKVDGRFRDGVLLVESFEVVEWTGAAKSARGAAAHRRVRVRGVVTNADPREFAVDGVRVDLPAKIERSLRRRPLRVGAPVVVDGRVAAGGRVAAARLRRN
jgi:hypothetical protein